jgi:hypothetical protein
MAGNNFDTSAFINTDKDREDWFRIDKATGDIFAYNQSSGQYDTLIHQTLHASSHEKDGTDAINNLGNIHFKGKVYASAGDENEGITESVVISGTKLHFKKGILWKVGD